MLSVWISLPCNLLSLSCICSFTAVFSPSKRRQLEQNLVDSTPRRSILPRWSPGADEEDGGGFPQAGATGYRKTNTIPVLKKTGKKQGRSDCGGEGGQCEERYAVRESLGFMPRHRPLSYVCWMEVVLC